MKNFIAKQAPKTEDELLERCHAILGLSFSQLACGLGLRLPDNPVQRKGWLGQAVEIALGTTAENKSLPDFHHLGIELKTLPIGASGKPAESTFICSIPLLTIRHQHWESSQCFNKLKRVLWLPVEGDTSIDFAQRRIGQGVLWSPSREQETTLKNDWTYFSNQISMGKLEEIDARHGDYLQIRPKAAHGKVLCDAIDRTGAKIKTLPRGFYLRASFTATIMASTG